MKSYISLSCALFLFPQEALLAQERPNFIQILTDDQGFGDLRCFGHRVIQTPNIDNLAQDGIKLTNCYSAHAVSSPSRAAILTGRTPFRNGVYRWIPQNHFCYLPASEVTVAQLLRESGYQTAHFGKWHLSQYLETRIPNSPDYTNYQFDFNPDQPSMKEYGYDYYFATGNVARPCHKDPNNFFLNGTHLGKLEGYSAQIVAARFIEWFNNRQDKNKPFFITVWFHEPHGPIDSDPRLVGRYKQVKDKSLAQYYANVTQIDEAVGLIVNALKKAGQYENTLIWYTSDNGPEGNGYGTYGTTDSPYDRSRHRGETGGFRERKRSNHEGGIHVPGIICWPEGFNRYGRKAGNITGTPVCGYDIMPTLLELAGVDKPSKVVLDGVSIVPLLKGDEQERERPLYWRNTSTIALRDGKWKIVGDPLRQSFALYNMSEDFRETTDLAAFYPEIFERLKNRLIAYDKEVLAEGPTWYMQDEKENKSIPAE